MNENEFLNERVKQAVTDENVLADLVREHKGFLLSIAARTAGHYVSESDDLWSAALIAFDEAVRTYAPDKGNFRSFAAVVVRRRLLDMLKKENRNAEVIPVAPDLMDGSAREDTAEMAIGLEIAKKEAEMDERQRQEEADSHAMKDEIDAVQKQLSQYGFSFYDLIKVSPKTEKTRTACARAAAVLVQNPALLQQMRTKRSLPAHDLTAAGGVSAKILDRHRKYIIAAAEITAGNYPGLGSYMHHVRKAMWEI